VTAASVPSWQLVGHVMRASTIALLALPSVALVSVACGGKTVIDPPLGSGGSGGAGTSVTGTTVGATTTVTTSTTTSGCAELEAQYRALVEKAKGCNPTANPSECIKFVPESLSDCCPRLVAVNAGAIVDLDTLTKLREAAGHCIPLCDGCPPPISVSGSCDAVTSLCQTHENLPD